MRSSGWGGTVYCNDLPAQPRTALRLRRQRLPVDRSIVGDGGTVYQISDVAVHPDHQGRELGTRMMERLEAYLEETVPPNAYVNLVADVDGFYERFGYEETRPASKGMYRRTE